MPFGLKNTPQIYQRKIDKIFSIFPYMLVYVDDILICLDNYENYIKYLKEFTNICKENGIILSQKKAKINKIEIEFLGMIITSNDIKLQSHISKKIYNFLDKLNTK